MIQVAQSHTRIPADPSQTSRYQSESESVESITEQNQN